MAVWFTRRLQCLLCEECTLLHAGIAARAGMLRTRTNDCRNNVLRTRKRAHPLNHDGAIV
jgi:hypothetical protein